MLNTHSLAVTNIYIYVVAPTCYCYCYFIKRRPTLSSTNYYKYLRNVTGLLQFLSSNVIMI